MRDAATGGGVTQRRKHVVPRLQGAFRPARSRPVGVRGASSAKPPPAAILPRMHAMTDLVARAAAALRAGLRFNLTTLGLILAIDTGIALLLWINEDQQPFWQPFVSVQLHGLAMAYCINVAAPWDHDRPLRRVTIATLVGALIGLLLVIVVKRYTLESIREMPGSFVFNLLAAFITGCALGLVFYVKRREARAAAAMHKAEAERHLLSKQAVEAELKLMQASIRRE